MTKEALLEIGSEELPASFITLGLRQLKTQAEESLKASGLAFTSIDVFGTPRRLAVLVQGLPERSPDQKKVITGPPMAVAKDVQGQWTPAAMGFARKQGLKPSDLTIENDRLSATLHIKGVATRNLLADLFPQWISKLEFPKSMIWEPTHFRYPRPIRWIAALFGSDLVSFSLAGVRSARWTLGIGPWAPKKIALTHAGKYLILLKNQCVLVEPGARQEAIRRSAEQTVKRVHGKVIMSSALLDQVGNLVEHPVAILGNFDPAYLDLPKEVLITCLEHHQKYFPVEQASGGKLLPHFVGIRNGMSVHQDLVREGYERVLSARLADARFFFNQDRKTPLAAKVDALRGVMFQQKLGNLFEKKERIKRILGAIAPAVDETEILQKAMHVTDLSKADLVTDMVREFPELQGIMARIYAQADGEDSVSAQALEEHYWPITLRGTLPTSDVAALVALADKLDTLAGDFCVGLIPTGSADPYGLRRAAVGTIRILESKPGWKLNLEWLVEISLESQPDNVKEGCQQTRIKLNQFMQQRFAAMLAERGYKADEIEAVSGSSIGTVPVALAKLEALHHFRKQPDFEMLANSFKRAANIVRQAHEKGIGLDGTDSPQADLLKESCERELWDSVSLAQSRLNGISSFEEILRTMVPLREPLARFFDGVMVMADDQSVRLNRLKLLNQVTKLFQNVADFSKLQNG